MRKNQEEELKRHRAEADALTRKAKALLAEKDASPRRKPKIWAIVLFMAVVWSLYICDHFRKHDLPRWFTITLCLAVSLGFTCYIVYCFLKGKVYTGLGPVHRSEGAFLYWAYLVFFLFWNIVMICLTIKFLVNGTI